MVNPSKACKRDSEYPGRWSNEVGFKYVARGTDQLVASRKMVGA